MTERAHWKSRLGFVLAAAGSAVGLGNIWKFPYVTGENGGGLFVLIYLACILLVGLPIMMAEIMIGRAAQKQPVGAFTALEGRTTNWSVIGWLGVFTGFVILSYYAVVAGWAMDYTLKSIVNFTNPIHREAELAASKFRATADLDEMRAMLVDRDVERSMQSRATILRSQLPPSVWRGYERFETAIDGAERPDEARQRLLLDEQLKTQVQQAETVLKQIQQYREKVTEEIGAKYDALPQAELLAQAEVLERRRLIFAGVENAFLATATDGWTCLIWSALFMGITIAIVAGGVSSGIERTCRILMPTLVSLILLMVVYGAFQPGFTQAWQFVFRPDPTRLKPSGVLEALGHAFFTLSLGMGAMITYGSYQQSKTGLAVESAMIALFDTLIALLACLMIFPIIFSYGQEPSAGPGLVFMSMPLAFAEIGTGGMLMAIVFFGLLVFAALTSAISLLEVVASYFIDQQSWSRPKAAIVTGGAIFLFGVPSAFSLDPSFFMTGWEESFGKNVFDTMDYLASNWMLPVGGLLIAIYTGWVMPARLREAEVQDVSPLLVSGWLFVIRFITPALVVLVLMQKVGILDPDEFLRLSTLPVDMPTSLSESP